MRRKRGGGGGGGGGTEADRRSKASSRPINSNKRRRTTSNSSVVMTLVIILGIIIIISLAYLLYSGSNYTDPDAAAAASSIPQLTYQQILTENAQVVSENGSRNFPNPVLAYVTPWNSKGYDLAKVFNSKFTHISPVWYDIKSQGAEFVLEGRHNVDKGWISELRTKGHALILPRFVLEAIPVAMLKEKKQRAKVIDLIIAECNFAESVFF